MTDEELNAIEARASAATPGPWLWNLNPKYKSLHLEAFIHCHEIVMDFVRWGMGGAGARFRKALKPDGSCAVMVHAKEFAKVVPGREHHATWFQTLDHPDAAFIAAARADVPALVAEVRRLRALLEGMAERVAAQGELVSRRAEG